MLDESSAFLVIIFMMNFSKTLSLAQRMAPLLQATRRGRGFGPGTISIGHLEKLSGSMIE